METRYSIVYCPDDEQCISLPEFVKEFVKNPREIMNKTWQEYVAPYYSQQVRPGGR